MPGKSGRDETQKPAVPKPDRKPGKKEEWVRKIEPPRHPSFPDTGNVPTEDSGDEISDDQNHDESE